MDATHPTFSIVIPTYNRPRPLGLCLQAVARLDFPRERFEVIVVDDGGEIPPHAAVAPFLDRLDLTVLTAPHGGPAAARNAGVARARGRFLAFTDDDCRPAPDWLRAFEARFAATPDRAIGGRTLNGLPDNPHSTASQVLIDYLYTYYNANPNRARFFASNNLAFPTSRFREVGGFDTTALLSAGEDREICDRWLRHGYAMTYAPEAIVYHCHHLTLRGFWWQHFNYGRGALYFRRKVARRSGRRITLERGAFYLRLLRYAWGQRRDRQALVLTALLGLSQAANAFGFGWEWAQGGRRGDRG